ncbi:MAG: penicillin-binding protein 1C [Anaerolineae bacterium]|nr:penicillin-binding protein 1C [Anaerolineae bacterium]
MKRLSPLITRFRRLRRWQQILIVAFTALLITFIGIYLWAFSDLPSINDISSGMALPSTRILDRNGRLLYEVIDPQGGRHTAIPLDQIPQSCKDATIATEDRNFYSTQGIDLEGILRALWINLQGGEIRAGGSTITQQVVRNLLIDPQQRAERSLRRKLREMVLAVQLANSKTHDDILALYLNQTYYGNLSYGIDAAAQVYFNKNAPELTLAECALIAGLPQTPALYDPITDPQAAKDRQRVVLDLMVVAGYLTQEQADAAYNEKLQYGNGQFEFNAPHFVQMIWSQLERDYPDVLYQGGLEVVTTLDLDWQRAAEAAALRQVIALNKPSGGKPSHNVHGAALVALDPKTGQVLALLGNIDYDDGSQDKAASAINMALAPRQPGSTLKPFTYALTFDPTQASPWTPATMILDVSTPFITRQLESYTPANYGLVEHGPVLIREALASSYNIPAVVALQHVGVNNLVELLHRLGVSTLTDPTKVDLSLTLGGGDVRLLDLTTAYAALANDGRPVTPSLILRVSDKSGKVLYDWQPAPISDRVLDPRVVYLITDILSDNEARRPAFGDHSALSIGRPAAAKTGTTTDFRDNWTVGYTPDVVVGVWAGNPDNTPMVDVSGVTGAGPIWNEFMREVLKNKPETPFQQPEGLAQAEICAASGQLPTQYCPQKKLEWFIAGTVPTDYDTMFQLFTIDRRSGLLATEETPAEDRVDRVFKVLPPEARLWGLRHGVEPPPVSPDQVASYPQTGFRLLTPDPYTIFQLTPLIPFEAQRIRFSVAVPAGTQRIEYRLNGDLISEVTADPWWAWWAILPGDYTLTARAYLSDGTTQDAAPLSFTVVSFVPPDSRPSSGTLP